MSCTTILVGKNAAYDGSTFIARNDDSSSGHFTPKKFTVVLPHDQPKEYVSELSHAHIMLPENPQRYTAVPNVLKGKGIWAAAGANECNVAMTATETITSNERVLGADPLVEYKPAAGSTPETPGGIGEEDFVVITLPYIRTAREGVIRLGRLIEEYGTSEMNGVAFSDVSEIWWFETIGGHHWIAKRVPDDRYVVMPNQLGIDSFDLKDAQKKQENHMCSAGLSDFIKKNHLNLAQGRAAADTIINPRDIFGSHDDADHVYNTPRAWFMERYFNPHTAKWDGPQADYTPESDTIPWSCVPEKKITVEDIKYVLSSHYQGTPYDPYATYGDPSLRGAYRSIGINRNDFMALFQIRPYSPPACQTIEWLSFGSNVFNALVPFYTNCTDTPLYLKNTPENPSTENFYWANRIIAALADAHYGACLAHIERYQQAVLSQGHAIINTSDQELAQKSSPADLTTRCEQANTEIAAMLKKETDAVLNNVLYSASCLMKNAYARSDA
jgi:dipeptidase